jgi:hypothetical protein
MGVIGFTAVPNQESSSTRSLLDQTVSREFPGTWKATEILDYAYF